MQAKIAFNGVLDELLALTEQSSLPNALAPVIGRAYATNWKR